MQGCVLVREQSEYGYGRASWEINLGCNYACSHCYLGLKEFSGLAWPDKVRLLDMMRDAGVVWLQVTGGEPTIDKHFSCALLGSAFTSSLVSSGTKVAIRTSLGTEIKVLRRATSRLTLRPR